MTKFACVFLLALSIPVTIRIEPAPGEGGRPSPISRRDDFTSDPKWESHRARLLTTHPPRKTRQSFGYSRTNFAGGEHAGEIGGFIQRAVEPGWYAARIEERTLDQRLSASGRFAVTGAEGGSGMLFGWFHESSRGWRTPNSLAFRLDGNGGTYWVFYEYGTRGWLTGGGGCFEGDAYQTTPTKPFAADGSVHDWSVVYEPLGVVESGKITFTLDEKAYELEVPPAHKLDGATFNRFGMFNQQTSGDGMDVYFDDLVLQGEDLGFADDPHWEARGNEGELADRFVRPLHDFGFSETSYAGGEKGEIGGVVWRDEPPAFYADRVGPLSLRDELYTEGSVVLRKAASDSAVYIGWFDAKSKVDADASAGRVERKSLLGVLIEGPSRAGHYFRAEYRTATGEGKCEDDGPTIRPDGEPHAWSIRYTPPRGDEPARIVVRFDGMERTTTVSAEHARTGATFDRFGIFNMSRGGLFVELYLDDLCYTAAGTGR